MTVPERHWRSCGANLLPTGAEAMAEPFSAFPSWMMRLTCDRCGKDRLLVETHFTQRHMTIWEILRRLGWCRHIAYHRPRHAIVTLGQHVTTVQMTILGPVACTHTAPAPRIDRWWAVRMIREAIGLPLERWKRRRRSRTTAFPACCNAPSRRAPVRWGLHGRHQSAGARSFWCPGRQGCFQIEAEAWIVRNARLKIETDPNGFRVQWRF
jgi:hypothetical protein